MQTIQKILMLAFIAMILVSCKKDKGTIVAVASLNVVNTSPGVSDALVRTSNVTAIYYAQVVGVGYSSNYVFTIPAGSSPVSVINQADTSKPVYSGTVTTNGGDVYSMFIGGAAGEDVVLNKDQLPYQADSSFGVRFVNMSYNSSPVNVTLSGSPSNEFSGVAYKALSDFKAYGAKSTDPGTYTFQVMDGSGNILATTSVSTGEPTIHHNVTLVFEGMIGGSGSASPGMFVVNNY